MMAINTIRKCLSIHECLYKLKILEYDWNDVSEEIDANKIACLRACIICHY